MSAVVEGVHGRALASVVEAHQRELSVRWTRLQGGLVVDRDELHLGISGLPVSWTNNVHGARLRSERVEPVIEEVVAALRDHRVPAQWWVGPGTSPADLGARLEDAGFLHEEDMPWMAAPIDAAPEVRVDGLVIRRVLVDRDDAAWGGAMVDGFGLTGDEHAAGVQLAGLVGADENARWQRMLGLLDEEPVASSGLMLAAGVVGVYNVSTVPSARGRGIGAAMTVAAMRRGAELGYRVAVLGSDAEAVPLYRRLGFRPVCEMGVYRWPGPPRH